MSCGGVGRDLPVLGVYRYADGRDPRLSFAIVRVGPPTGTYDECWVSVWPANPDGATWLLRQSVAVSPDLGQVTIGQLNTRFGEDLRARDRFAHRTGRFALGGAAVAGGLLVVEAAMAGLAVLAASVAVVTAYAGWTGAWEVRPFGLRVCAAGAFGMIAAAVLAGLSVSPRRVFAHVKNR